MNRNEKQQMILAVLHEENGVTAAHICEVLDDPEFVPSGVGKMLGKMEREGLVESGSHVAHENGGGKLWYLSGSHVPARQTPAAQPDGLRVQIPAYQRQRQGRRVSLFTSIIQENEVVQVWLKPVGQAWVRLPMWGDLRICQGPDSPDEWGVEREVYYQVEALRLVRADGKAQEYRQNPAYPLTIAPEGI